MRFLPPEIIKTIFEHFNIWSDLAFSKTNMKNYILLKDCIDQKIDNLITIQNFYKKHRTSFPFEESYMNIYFEPNKKRKLFIVRSYIARYPLVLIYSYPEYLVEKTSIYNSENKKTFLTKYLEKMPEEKKRTRRDILNFLCLDCITVRDIVYTGW